jgi:hypothetical protein
MPEIHNRFIKLPPKAKLQGSALKFATPSNPSVVNYTDRQGRECSVDLRTPADKLTGDALDAAIIHLDWIGNLKQRAQIKR